MALTDGQAHDAPADPATFDEPRTAARAADRPPDESDRQLAILQAPSFGVVGEEQTMELRVDDARLPTPTPGFRSPLRRTAASCAS